MAEPKTDVKKVEDPVLTRADRLKAIGAGKPDPAATGEPSPRAARLKDIGATRNAL